MPEVIPHGVAVEGVPGLGVDEDGGVDDVLGPVRPAG
jgi:hypothetical protein